jgi:copper(I)-binding protein
MFRLFLALLLLAVPAFAHNYTHGDIRIGHVWASQTSDKAKIAAAYVPLLNLGKEEDALTKAETPAAKEVQFHQTKIEKGVAKMRRIKEVKILGGQQLNAAPGGLHLMLLGLKEPLKDGARIPLTLYFAKAGEVKVEIHVQKTPSTNNELHENH